MRDNYNFRETFKFALARDYNFCGGSMQRIFQDYCNSFALFPQIFDFIPTIRICAHSSGD